MQRRDDDVSFVFNPCWWVRPGAETELQPGLYQLHTNAYLRTQRHSHFHTCIKYLNVHFLPSDDAEQYLIISNLFMTILTACDMCCGQNSCFWGWLMIYGKYGFCCCISLRKCFTNSRTIVNSCIVADNKGVVVSIIILPLDLIRCSTCVNNKYVDKDFPCSHSA